MQLFHSGGTCSTLGLLANSRKQRFYTMLSKLLGFAGLVLALAVEESILAVDDECSVGDAECALNALQLRGAAANSDEPENATEESLGGGWYQGGDKMWGSGAGTESITGGNVHYYDSGMSAARARCGGSGCALIINPPGHRSINKAHIHFVHYGGYGHSLKSRMEKKVCGHGGWHGGGLPCGGKAKFFPGFPGVFSAAMSGGSVAHASVIAWPASCGGSGTIVELAYGCSIEHQIRGDFNPRLR